MIRRIIPFMICTCSILAASNMPAFADYTVTGRFQYEDRAFDISGFTGAINFRPIRFAEVRILAGATVLATGSTNADGVFSILVPGSTAQPIQASCLASSSVAPGPLLEVRSAGSTFSFGSIYTIKSPTVNSPGADTVPMGTTLARASSSSGKAFNIWDAAYDGMEFISSVSGSFPEETLTILWSSSHAVQSSFYGSNPSRFAFIGSPAGYDDPIIFHQFGHFAADVFSKLDNPLQIPVFGDGDQDIRLAWSEGVSLFIGASIRSFKGYPRPDAYILTNGTNLLYSMEIESLTSENPLASILGSTNMLAVCAALWDITDGPDTGDAVPGDDDPLERPFSDVWRVLTDYFPTLSSEGLSVEDFWDGWFSAGINNGHATEMRSVFADLNGIEFTEDPQEPDNSTGEAADLPVSPLVLGSGPGVVINELELGPEDRVELLNTGDAEVNLAGWTVTASRAGSIPALLELPSYRLKPGSVVVLSESAAGTGNLNFGVDIPWLHGNDGACALRDPTGMGMDFVRWGGSREFPPGGTGFTGSNPGSPGAGSTLARNFSGTDSDAGADWNSQIASLGTLNRGGQERHHTFYPMEDIDYASFDATAGRYYIIETFALANGVDPILDLYGTNGFSLLATSDDRGPTKAARIAWAAPAAGRYFIKVRRYAGMSNYTQYGSFDLRIIESAKPLGSIIPTVLTVSRAGQGGMFNSLSEAVTSATNGDTVQIIDSDIYEEALQITGKSITIKSAPGQNPVLDGRDQPAPATLLLDGFKNIEIDGLTIYGGSRGIRITNGNALIANTVVNRVSSTGSDPDGIQIIGARAHATIINCTVVNNGRVGIGVFDLASAKVINSIVRDNASIDIASDESETSLEVKNSLVPTGDYAGENGNIDGDPMFVNAAKDDFHLQSSSPAIDKGARDSDLPATDAEGLPRILDGDGDHVSWPDMGAYEYFSPDNLTDKSVFPQIAVGGPQGAEYRTLVIGVNTGARTAVTRLSFTGSNGNPLSLDADGETGSTFDMLIAPAGTVRVETTGSDTTRAGYARFLSNTPINGTALFKILDGEKTISQAGVGLSKPTKSFTVYIDNLDNAFSGYAVANYNPATANLTLRLRDKDGNLLATLPYQILAGLHIAKFAAEADQFGDAAGAGFEGTIEFESDLEVAAVALRFDNAEQDVFSTIPVLVDEAGVILYFPQAADGGGYRTNFILVNPGDTAVTATLEFFASDGSVLELPIGGIMKSSHQVELSARGAARFLTDGTSPGVRVGWVRVTSPQPLGGSAIFQTLANDRITSQAGVAASPLAGRFTGYVESLGYAESGLAICNPNDSAVTITLNLRDAVGNLVATTSFELPSLGHVAKFFTQWFPGGFGEFEGTLEVVASLPVSAVALRFDNPEQDVFATLPVIVIP